MGESPGPGRPAASVHRGATPADPARDTARTVAMATAQSVLRHRFRKVTATPSGVRRAHSRPASARHDEERGGSPSGPVRKVPPEAAGEGLPRRRGIPADGSKSSAVEGRHRGRAALESALVELSTEEAGMPAVTVEDTTTLPRVPVPAPGTVRRRVRSVTTAPSGFEGEGFPVRRAFAGVDLRDLDPFIHMDQMGEVEYAPGEPKGTSWHPHRGFETVTYIIDGTFEHADSHGGGGTISNGDTQWMTAGGGVLHIERPPEHLVLSGGLFHGLQLWVNLPRAQKWVEPRYQDLRARESVLMASPDGGALVRVIAGDVGGRRGPGSTYTPMAMVHATVSPGATLDLPWRPDFNALVYVLSGSGSVGIDAAPVRTGQLVVLGPGDTVTVAGTRPGDRHAQSRTPDLDVVVLGGLPIREPIAMYGPFVMNTRQEVLDAMADASAGRLGSIPATHTAHGDLRGESE